MHVRLFLSLFFRPSHIELFVSFTPFVPLIIITYICHIWARAGRRSRGHPRGEGPSTGIILSDERLENGGEMSASSTNDMDRLRGSRHGKAVMETDRLVALRI